MIRLHSFWTVRLPLSKSVPPQMPLIYGDPASFPIG
jgi:hypothetical protein